MTTHPKREYTPEHIELAVVFLRKLAKEIGHSIISEPTSADADMLECLASQIAAQKRDGERFAAIDLRDMGHGCLAIQMHQDRATRLREVADLADDAKRPDAIRREIDNTLTSEESCMGCGRIGKRAIWDSRFPIAYLCTKCRDAIVNQPPSPDQDREVSP